VPFAAPSEVPKTIGAGAVFVRATVRWLPEDALARRIGKNMFSQHSQHCMFVCHGAPPLSCFFYFLVKPEEQSRRQ
jgi:hypothetical protein